MNAKRLGFIFIAILLMGLSYWAMSMVNNDVKSVKVDPEQHTLMVISNDAVISKRILGMKQIGDDVYFLGYEGYGIYNVKENTIRLNAIQFKGNHIEPGQLKNYHKGVRHVETVANFQDFSADEQRNFSDLLNATDKGAHYIKPYYQSGYESSLIDLDKKFFITNNVNLDAWDYGYGMGLLENQTLDGSKIKSTIFSSENIPLFAEKYGTTCY